MKALITTCWAAALLSGGAVAAQPATSAEPVYVVVDRVPRFKSGDSTMTTLLDHLLRNTRYPVDALIDKATGRVFVSFVVNKSGRVEQATVVKGVHRALNKEALRVVSEMPLWEVPGRLRGQPVSVSFTVPIAFNMRDATPKESREIMAGEKQRQLTKRLNEAQGQLSQATAPGGDVGPVFTADPLGAANYISRSVQYPLDAQRARQEGVVLMAFVVNAAGAVTDVRVTKGLFPSLDAEARRVIESMPPWRPGTRAGRPTAVPFSDVPVTFRLR